jgi:hypothetical protein
MVLKLATADNHQTLRPLLLVKQLITGISQLRACDNNEFIGGMVPLSTLILFGPMTWPCRAVGEWAISFVLM